MKPKLLIAESQGFSSVAIRTLNQQFSVDLHDLERSGLLKTVGEFDALWVRVRTMIDAEVFDAAPNLKWIATNTTGLTHIDLEAAKSRGIQVISLQGESEFLKSIRATAELTLGLTLALLRRIPSAVQHARLGGWDRDQFQGREIFGQTVGIVGYGRLGKIVATYFAALGATVILHDRLLKPNSSTDGFMAKSFADLLAESDIISVHVSYEPKNYHLFGAQQFAQMKPTAIFVNTARGELVDESALATAIESGALAGAATDVLEAEHELTVQKQRLLEIARVTDRLLITPHIGGNTFESMARTEEFLAEKLCGQLKVTGSLK